MKIDKVGALSSIPPRVLFVTDIYLFQHRKIDEIGNFQLQEAYEELCVDGKLKDEFKHLETKGLTHVVHFPKEFKNDWIRIFLS